jgi:hypothetical protein
MRRILCPNLYPLQKPTKETKISQPIPRHLARCFALRFHRLLLFKSNLWFRLAALFLCVFALNSYRMVTASTAPEDGPLRYVSSILKGKTKSANIED